jgi:hypothetical protein
MSIRYTREKGEVCWCPSRNEPGHEQVSRSEMFNSGRKLIGTGSFRVSVAIGKYPFLSLVTDLAAVAHSCGYAEFGEYDRLEKDPDSHHDD